MKAHPNELSDHGIVEANIELDFKIDKGPGIWRLNTNVLPSNYKFFETFLEQQTVNSANYDAIKQELRENLRNNCIAKSILSKHYRNDLQNALENDVDNNQQITKVIDDEDETNAEELLSTMKRGFNRLNEGTPWSQKLS